MQSILHICSAVSVESQSELKQFIEESCRKVIVQTFTLESAATSETAADAGNNRKQMVITPKSVDIRAQHGQKNTTPSQTVEKTAISVENKTSSDKPVKCAKKSADKPQKQQRRDEVAEKLYAAKETCRNIMPTLSQMAHIARNSSPVMPSSATEADNNNSCTTLQSPPVSSHSF